MNEIKNGYIYNEERLYSYNRYYEKHGNSDKVIDEQIIPFDLPKGWCFCKIKYLATLFNGDSINADVKKQKYTNLKEGYNYIGTKDIGYDNLINYENGVKIPYTENFKICPNGKVLLCIEGRNAGNKIAISTENVCFGNKLVCFNTFYFNDLYLFIYLQSSTFKEIFKSKETGLIGGVSVPKIGDTFLPIPPINEQNEITKLVNVFLLKLRNLNIDIQELENLKDKIKVKIIKLGLVGKLLKGDDNSYYTKTTLNTCGKLISGRDLSLNLINNENRGIPYITGASQIEDGNIVLNRWTESPCVISELNDVLITVKGTIGKTAINNYGNMHIARQIMAFRTNEHYIPKFIELCFKESSKELNYKNNSLIPGASRNYILNIKLNAFPISYQTKLISKINQIDTILATM